MIGGFATGWYYQGGKSPPKWPIFFCSEVDDLECRDCGILSQIVCFVADKPLTLT